MGATQSGPSNLICLADFLPLILKKSRVLYKQAVEISTSQCSVLAIAQLGFSRSSNKRTKAVRYVRVPTGLFHQVMHWGTSMEMLLVAV